MGDCIARPLKKEVSKSLVLQSASKLFIERWYQDIIFKDIATDAAVSYNDVLRLFGDKETILSELIELVLEC